MASGYRNGAGSDFDDVFDLYVQGDKGLACGYRSGDGNDLNQRYAPLAYGAKAADVGYRDASGSDLSNRWARKGSAQYALGFNGNSYSTSREALTNQQGNISASVTIGILNNGTWSIGADTGSPMSGSWLPAGRSASEYNVQIEGSGMNRATFASTASSYASCAASQSATVTATVRAASVDLINEGVWITVYLRDSAGIVTASTFGAAVYAHGWV